MSNGTIIAFEILVVYYLIGFVAVRLFATKLAATLAYAQDVDPVEKEKSARILLLVFWPGMLLLIAAGAAYGFIYQLIYRWKHRTR